MTGSIEPLNTSREMRWLQMEAAQVAKSTLVPKDLRDKPEDLMLIALEGHALGLRSLVHALKHVYVIEGRTVLSAQLRLSLANAAGHASWVTETESSVTVHGHRRGRPDQVTSVTFSLDDARTAGLLDEWWERWEKNQDGRSFVKKWVVGSGAQPDWVGKAGSKLKRRDNWHLYPKDMMRARAICRWVASVCPEVLLSLPVLDVPLEEVDRTAFAEPPAPSRESFIDVEEADDGPVDESLIDAPPRRADWPTEWRRGFGDRWDRTVSAALIHHATKGRTDMASNVIEAEQAACDNALDLWLAGELQVTDGRVAA